MPTFIGRTTQHHHPKATSFKHLKSKAQSDMREMKAQWWQRKATEVQQYADSHNWSELFSSVRPVCGASSTGSPPSAFSRWIDLDQGPARTELILLAQAVQGMWNLLQNFLYYDNG